MNDEKQIAVALELLKVLVSTNPNIIKTPAYILAEYKKFLKGLNDEQRKEVDIKKLQDEVETYRYLFKAIASLMEKDESNFVYKDELKMKMGGYIIDKDRDTV